MTWWLPYPHHLPILRLQFQQTLSAHTAIIILADVLHLVNAQLHHTALAFGVGICLTLYAFTATLAGDDLMFGHFESMVHSR